MMIFGPKTLKNCFKDPEMHILSESIGLYPKMKSKWCYLEYFYEISVIFRPKIAFLDKILHFLKTRKVYRNPQFSSKLATNLYKLSLYGPFKSICTVF